MNDQLAKNELHICNDIYLQFYCKDAATLPHKHRFHTKFEKLEYGPSCLNSIIMLRKAKNNKSQSFGTLVEGVSGWQLKI